VYSPSSQRTVLGLPAWLPFGLVLVGVLALCALIASDATWAVVATAMATVLLALFTAQLYSAAVAQLRASVRPLLVEVKPYAAPPPDLGGHLDPATGRHRYNIEFPDDFQVSDWDGRRPFVYANPGERLRVSIVLRNVGTGLALIKSDEVRLTADEQMKVALRRVRYPRLPAGESTRVNLVFEGPRCSKSQTEPITVVVPYSDLSDQHRESALVRLEYMRTRARTRDEGGNAWIVTRIDYSSA
jgi:hypothetical protein